MGVIASASFGNPPTVSGISPWIASPGQQIVISGNHFSNDFTSDCSLSGAPTVNFEGVNGQVISGIRPASNGSADCSNSSVKVTVPTGFTDGARIQVVDSSGQPSNNNLQMTLQPTAIVSPSSGQVGVAASINATNGTNLHPATVPSGAKLHLTYPGIDTLLGSWGNQIAFNPNNQSGAAQVSFPVYIDVYNPSSQQTVTVPAGNYTFLKPVANTSTAITGKAVGDQLTISGSNLGSGGKVTFNGGAQGQVINWGSSQVTATVPAGAQPGPLTLLVTGYGSIPGPAVSLNPLVKTMTPGSGSAGTAVAIAGYNFGTTAGTVTAGGVSQTVTSWADQAIAFSLSGDTDSGGVTITRAAPPASDSAAATGPNLIIIPRLDKIETNNVKAGASIVVDGVSLGAAAGTAKVGSTAAMSQLWSRTSVLLTVPASLAPGTYPVVLTSASGAASNALNLTVVPGPAASAPSSSPNKSNPAGLIDENHQFHKPPKTDSPVQLSLTLAKHQLKAGGTCDLTVVLTLNGKPVSGAQVKLRMLYTPDSDYKFMPDTGVTDSTGTFTAKVQISKVSGDTIVEADSGIFSDQDHIVGAGGVAPLATVNPANTGGIVPLAGLGVVALMLVGLGVWLNLRSSRTVPA